ncbi:hypothetical protein ACQW02_20615 [Humitalea sp. 24SJ18S-53]|uniref:hypothetical protein n=1 Tax=Humitalea sp. 24SJ18S-53 TaxID=3422307 RepID=UPI003D67458F
MKLAHLNTAGAVMSVLVRIILAASAAITALFLSRDSDNFGVVSAMVGVALVAAVVVIAALASRKK